MSDGGLAQTVEPRPRRLWILSTVLGIWLERLCSANACVLVPNKFWLSFGTRSRSGKPTKDVIIKNTRTYRYMMVYLCPSSMRCQMFQTSFICYKTAQTVVALRSSRNQQHNFAILIREILDFVGYLWYICILLYVGFIRIECIHERYILKHQLIICLTPFIHIKSADTYNISWYTLLYFLYQLIICLTSDYTY